MRQPQAALGFARALTLLARSACTPAVMMEVNPVAVCAESCQTGMCVAVFFTALVLVILAFYVPILGQLESLRVPGA